MFSWLQDNEPLLWWLGLGSIVMFVAGVILVPVLIARIPADYFSPERAPPPRRHPVLALLLRIGKNLLGALLIVLGIAMLVLPGQGILTILLGLSLIEFPYKRRLELALIRRPPVLRAVNWIRGSKTLIVPGVQPPEK
jgi:hypothetical protein